MTVVLYELILIVFVSQIVNAWKQSNFYSATLC